MKQGEKQNIKTNESYFLTLTVVKWIKIFNKDEFKNIIINSLRYCIKNKGLNVYSYCIMPDHLHMIVNTEEQFELKGVIRDFKKYTSKEIVNQINSDFDQNSKNMLAHFAKAAKSSSKHKNFKLWQAGNHAIELYNESFTWTKINYIHNNPVKAGLADKPEDWMYSSASNYYELESVLKEVYCLPGRLISS